MFKKMFGMFGKEQAAPEPEDRKPEIPSAPDADTVEQSGPVENPEDIISKLAQINSIIGDEDDVVEPVDEFYAEEPVDDVPEEPVPDDPDVVHLPMEHVFSLFPPECLVEAADVLGREYNGAGGYTVALHRSEISGGLAVGRVALTMGELAHKIGGELFTDVMTQRVDEPLEVPLMVLMPLIPPAWFDIGREQDNSRDKVVSEMDDLFTAFESGDDEVDDSGPVTFAEAESEDGVQERAPKRPVLDTVAAVDADDLDDDNRSAADDIPEPMSEPKPAPPPPAPPSVRPPSSAGPSIRPGSVPSVPPTIKRTPSPSQPPSLTPPSSPVLEPTIAPATEPPAAQAPSPSRPEPVVKPPSLTPPSSPVIEPTVAPAAEPPAAQAPSPSTPEPVVKPPSLTPPSSPVIEPTVAPAAEPPAAQVPSPSTPAPAADSSRDVITPAADLAPTLEPDADDPVLETSEPATESTSGVGARPVGESDTSEDDVGVLAASLLGGGTHVTDDDAGRKDKADGPVVEWRSQAPNGIDINRADVTELCLLNGVGDHLATSIVEHRSAHGRFRTLQDLLSIPGLGEHTYRSMTRTRRSADLRACELAVNKLLNLDGDTVSLTAIATQTLAVTNMKAIFIGSTDGLILAQHSRDAELAKLADSLAAVGPQLYRRAAKALRQGRLPETDMFSFYMGRNSVTFAGADQVFVGYIHDSQFPSQKELRLCRRLASELVWYCSYRAVIG